jgi:hypothetical protein
MTYEEYLDEVTTLIVEKYDLDDAAAIKIVVDAQAAGYFVAHDDQAAMRTLDRAHADARALFDASSHAQARPAGAPRSKAGRKK